MSGLSYETVSKLAQQGGSIYFTALFLGGVIYAAWPRHKDEFKRLASLPLEDDEGDHV